MRAKAVPVADMIGKKFGRLTAVRLVEPVGRGARMEFLCDCGNTHIAYATLVRRGSTKSCGCSIRKHGRYKTKEYRAWANAKYRCENPRCACFDNYGGRGIGMCERWSQSFEAFYQDMGDCPPHLTLERIDNNLGYEPENCRWATRSEQNANKRILGVKKFRQGRITDTVAGWARRLGISKGSVWSRIYRGIPLDQPRRAWAP